MNLITNWWGKTSLLGRITGVVVVLLGACCVLSVPIALLSPDSTLDAEATVDVAAATQEEDEGAENTSRSNEIVAVTEEIAQTAMEVPTEVPTEPPATTTSEPTVVRTQPPDPTATAEPTAIPSSNEPPLAPTATLALSSTTGEIIIVAVNKPEEYVDIQNVSGTDIMLTGWVLRSERGPQDCPLDGVGLFPAGYTLRVWAMEQPIAEGQFNCEFESEIWNNSETDAAVLIDPNGSEVARQ